MKNDPKEKDTAERMAENRRRMNTDAPELTILMPCLNEEETIGICIEKARRFLADSGVSGEVLIADNGSTDRSPQLAREAGARVVHVPEKGYGAALWGGIRAAYGTYVIMGDADDSYDFLNLMPFVEKLREGYDLVMGNRFRGGIEKGAMPFLHQYLGNPVLSWIGRVFYRSRVGDFHCGLRGFNRESMLALDLKTTGMEFASEMVVMASLHGYAVAEVPTTLSKDGRSGTPHLRTFRDGWRHLKFLLIYCPRWLFLYPGIFLVCVGLIGLISLSFGDIRIGSVTFGIHTMLYMAGFVVVGLQIIMFKVLSDVYAAGRGFLYVTEEQKRKSDFFTTDRVVLAGAVLLVIGIIFTILSVRYWANTGYGDLVPQVTMRRVIPGWTMIITGMQLICQGFFLGILRIR